MCATIFVRPVTQLFVLRRNCHTLLRSGAANLALVPLQPVEAEALFGSMAKRNVIAMCVHKTV